MAFISLSAWQNLSEVYFSSQRLSPSVHQTPYQSLPEQTSIIPIIHLAYCYARQHKRVSPTVTCWYCTQTNEDGRGSCGLHCEVAKHSSFLIPTMVGGDVPFHQKFLVKVTHPVWQAPTSTNICLSLIHIWRCRRIERCRSRWSPYH